MTCTEGPEIRFKPWAAAARTRGRPFVSQFTFFKKVPELKLPLPTDICTYMRTKITAISELIQKAFVKHLIARACVGCQVFILKKHAKTPKSDRPFPADKKSEENNDRMCPTCFQKKDDRSPSIFYIRRLRVRSEGTHQQPSEARHQARQEMQ